MEKTRLPGRWRKALRLVFFTFFGLFALLAAAFFALTRPAVQQFLTEKAQTFLQKKLGTRVEVGAVRVRFPIDLSLENFLLEDQNGDTLARVGSLTVGLRMWELLGQTVDFESIRLENAAVFIHQKDSISANYDFIVRAFAADTTAAKPADSTASAWKMQFDLTDLQLKNVSFLMLDDDSKSTTEAKIGTAETVISNADLKNLQFELADLALADSDIRLISKKKSTSEKLSPQFDFLIKNGDIARSRLVYSTTEMSVDAFLETAEIGQFQIRSAPGLMAVAAQNVQLENSSLIFRDPEAVATPGHFNPSDLDLTQLTAEIAEFSMQNDSIFVKADALSGLDKSGLQVHSLKTTAFLTPEKIEIKKALASLNRTFFDGDVLLFKTVAPSAVGRPPSAVIDRMEIEIRRTKGIVGDLNILMPPPEIEAFSQLRDLPFEVSGKLSGWLENLQTENVKFSAGSVTVAHFTGSVQRVSEPEKLGFQLIISKLETNRADLVRFMSLGETPMDSILAQPLPAFLSASGEVAGGFSSLKIGLRGEVGPLVQTAPAGRNVGRNSMLQHGFQPERGAMLNRPYSAPQGLKTDSGQTFLPTFRPAGAVQISGDALQFDIAGTLTEANNSDKLGLDLTIHQLDAPRSFFSFFETPDRQFPDFLKIKGSLKGPLASLQTDLKFDAERSGQASQLTFNGLLKNLRTPEKLGFDATFDGSLARAEILGYVADSLITNTLRLPDFIKIKGEASGSTTAAVGKTEIRLGDFGQIFLDGKLRDSTFEMSLAGQNLRVNQLAVDTFLRPMKAVGFTTKISGVGFDFGKTARLKLAGKLDSIVWENLILREIALDLDANGRRFSGGFNSPDERVAVHLRANGDFSTAIPMLDFDLKLDCLDLREFGWASRPTTVCGQILSHSEGLSLDTLLAKIAIKNIDLQYDTVHIRPGDVAIDLKLDNKNNSLAVGSDWLEGKLGGHFSIADLPETIANIAEQYLAVDRSATLPKTGTDSLAAHFHLLKSDVLTTGLLPGLTELGVVHLELDLVARRNFFNLFFAAPRIAYLAWAIDSLEARSFAGDSAAMFVLTMPLVKNADKAFIENAVFDGRFLKNVADVSFKASDEAGRERFMLAAQGLLNNQTKTSLVRLAPRQIIDFKEWSVNAENEVKIAPGGIEIRDFEMAGNGQSIKIGGATKKLAAGKTGLDFAVKIERLDFGNFDVFIAETLSELGGWADADLTIKGTTAAPLVRGKMQLHEASFTPVATNVRYELSETPLEFSQNGVNLDGLTLRDPFGKTLEINGKLTTSDWSNIETNLVLKARNWQVLNSTKRENPVFFGELFVSLDGTLRGPISQPDLQIVVKTAKESSFTYVYDAATAVLQSEGVVYFVQPPRQNVRPPIYDAPVTTMPFTLSASVEIDSNLTINSVINPVTGDDFRGKASGTLQFDQLSNGQMTLAGRVELVRGVYNYSYQSVVKRSFEVTTGSSITWTGDPFTPELDLRALYQFKASPYPLVINQLSSASAEEAASFRRPQTFFLQTSLKGSAREPEVGFEFIYPDSERSESLGSSFGSQQAGLVQSALGNVNQDKNLLSRQVFGVLLLKNFIGETVGSINTEGSGATLQSGLTSFLTGQINALADQYLSFIDVDLTTTEGSAGSNSGQSDGSTNYSLRLQKSFFEDRLTFKISGGTTVGGESEAQTGLENASIEYALNRKGELKVTVFSEKGFELLNASSANLRNSGAGLILTREFGGRKAKGKR